MRNETILPFMSVFLISLGLWAAVVALLWRVFG